MRQIDWILLLLGQVMVASCTKWVECKINLRHERELWNQKRHLEKLENEEADKKLSEEVSLASEPCKKCSSKIGNLHAGNSCPTPTSKQIDPKIIEFVHE